MHIDHTMENRVLRFYELHNNKWFHVMNWSLDIIKTKEMSQIRMLEKYGASFFF